MGKAIVFAGKDARLLTSRDLLSGDSTIYPKTGEKNYISSPSSPTAWTATGTITAVTVTTGLPRTNTTKTGISFAVGAAADYARSRFILDPADYGKKLKVQFDMVESVGTDWKVDVYGSTDSGVTYTNRLSLSTDSAAVSALPGLTGTYRTTFDAPGTLATSYIELRIVRVANASALVISDVVVGPGVVVQGAAVGDWSSYTPTWTGGSPAIGNGVLAGFSKRDGADMLVRIEMTTGTTTTYGSGAWSFSIPSGFTIDTSVLQTDFRQVGLASATVTASANTYDGIVLYGTSTTLQVVSVGGVSASNWAPTVPATWTAATGSQRIRLEARFRVNEWAGAGTVNVAQNDVMYASNSDSTSTATNTTSFAYGPAGSPIPNGAISVSYTRRVRFTQPVPLGVVPRMTVQEGGTGTFVPIEGRICGFIKQGASAYGVLVAQVTGSSTDFDVIFQPSGISPTNATYAGLGSPWSGLTTWNWRLEAGLPGQAIGFSAASDTANGLLNFYKTELVSGTMGGFSSGGLYSGKITRASNLVTLSLYTQATGTKSGTSAATITIPASYLPTTTVNGIINFSQNGNARSTVLWGLTSGGTLSIYGDLTGSNVTAAVGCGFNEGATLSWSV